MRAAAFAVLVAAVLAWAGVYRAQSSAIPSASVGRRADVNADGAVNSLDLKGVAANFGAHYDPNPCVDYASFDDTHLPPPDTDIVNSLGEIITPRGGMYLVYGEHPQYATIRAGGVPDLWVCPTPTH